MTTHSIKTKTARQSLSYQKNPYWHQLSVGLSIGYSVPIKGGDGSWHVRVYRGAAGYKSEKIPKEVFKENSVKDTKFEQACAYAQGIADRIKKDSPTLKTVGCIAKAYLDEKIRVSGGAEKVRRLISLVNSNIIRNEISQVAVHNLDRSDIDGWINKKLVADPRDHESYRKNCETINRNLRQLKAILNWGYANGFFESKSSWDHVKAFQKVNAKRDYIPTKSDYEKVYTQADDLLRSLMSILIETGMRPGEPLRLKVKDFDIASSKVIVPVETKTGSREIFVNASAASILNLLANKKKPEDYIVGPGSKPIESSFMSKKFREAVVRADVDRRFVLYSLRHLWISAAVTQRSVAEVAKYAGTSIQMIDSFYMKINDVGFIKGLSSPFEAGIHE